MVASDQNGAGSISRLLLDGITDFSAFGRKTTEEEFAEELEGEKEREAEGKEETVAEEEDEAIVKPGGGEEGWGEPAGRAKGCGEPAVAFGESATSVEGLERWKEEDRPLP